MPASYAALFDALLEASTDNIYMFDRGGRYRHVSRAGAQALGSTSGQMIGKTWRELRLPGDIMTSVEQRIARVFSTGETSSHHVPYRGRIYEYSIFPVDDLVAVVSRDVTDFVRAVESYRSFVANSSEGVWRFDLDAPIATNATEEQQVEQAAEVLHEHVHRRRVGRPVAPGLGHAA